jgi:hypothetical protein
MKNLHKQENKIWNWFLVTITNKDIIYTIVNCNKNVNVNKILRELYVVLHFISLLV